LSLPLKWPWQSMKRFARSAPVSVTGFGGGGGGVGVVGAGVAVVGAGVVAGGAFLFSSFFLPQAPARASAENVTSSVVFLISRPSFEGSRETYCGDRSPARRAPSRRALRAERC
jgi:hypothetical protein